MEYLFFFLASVGTSHILVESELLRGFRTFVKRKCNPTIAYLVSCYQCTGFWCGMVWYGLFATCYPMLTVPLFIGMLAGGCAVSFLSMLTQSMITFFDAAENRKADK